MKKVLVVIDMQNDFIDGALGTEEAKKIVDPVTAKIREYAGKKVFATRDTHGEDYLETSEGRHLPVIHCVRGTEGWQLNKKVEEALIQVDAEIIDKPTFGSEILADKLFELDRQEKEQGKDGIEIELVGLCTDICVVSNALLIKSGLYETPIKVAAKCCAGVTPESHEAALLTMKMCQVEVE